jgi:hypothetical protein
MRFKEFLLQERDENFHKQPRWKPAKKKLPPMDPEKMAAKYDGKPYKVKLPVINANGKRTEKEFTIDNTLQSRRAVSGQTMQDMHQIEADPTKRSQGASYAFHDPRQSKGGSIPARLHGLPERTRRKAGYEPEDLRREVYAWNG